MERVQHTSTNLVFCLFFDFEGTWISTTCRLLTCWGSKSKMPLTLLLIACPDPLVNFTVLRPTSFVNSKEQTNLQGTRLLSLRSCWDGISIFPGLLWALTPESLGGILPHGQEHLQTLFRMACSCIAVMPSISFSSHSATIPQHRHGCFWRSSDLQAQNRNSDG